jgi:hypothetical protein
MVIETGFFTAAAAGSAVATPMGGDTFTVPSFNLASPAWLEQLWGQGASQDWISVKSPRMHDSNQGIRLFGGVGSINPLLPWGSDQRLYPSDTPTVTLDETAVATGAVAAIYGFSDLPGTSQRLASWSEVQPRIVGISGVQVNVSASTAIGNWSPGNPINGNFDNFEAGADYAILGYVTSTSVLAIAINGQDTSGLKVGGPGVADPKVTYDWFRSMSDKTGRPYIPLIAANNKGGTLVYQTANAVAAAQSISLIMAQLA